MSKGLTKAAKEFIEAVSKMDKYKAALDNIKTLADDALEQLTHLLMKTRRADNGFNEEFVYGWEDGWNYFEIEGKTYQFLYSARNNSISRLEEIKVVKIEEKEVGDEQ